MGAAGALLDLVLPYVIFRTMLEVAERGWAADVSGVLSLVGYAVAAFATLYPAGRAMHKALHRGRSLEVAAKRGLKAFFKAYGILLAALLVAAPFMPASAAGFYEAVVFGLPLLALAVVAFRAVAVAAHRRLAFRGEPLLRHSRWDAHATVDSVEDAPVDLAGAVAAATIAALALRAPLPVVAAVAAGGAAAAAAAVRAAGLRAGLRQWKLLASDLGSSLKILTTIFALIRRPLVLGGKMSDRALHLYYYLEQARMVERFLIDPRCKMDADAIEAAKRESPGELGRWVTERVLERLGETLELVDPQGLRIYRAPDGRFHVAAGDVVDVPIPEPRAALGAVEDVIAYLRAEIERETGRPYRPLVLQVYMPSTAYFATCYTVDAVGLEEEMAEDEELVNQMAGVLWSLLNRVPSRVFDALVEYVKRALEAEEEKREGQRRPEPGRRLPARGPRPGHGLN